MSKRRKKKDFRPRRSTIEATQASALVEQTPEPVTLTAETPAAIEEATPIAQDSAPIEEEPRRRTDSLEPVAFLAHRDAAIASEEDLANESEEAIARDVPRPPSRFVPIVRNVVAACALLALVGGTRAALKHARASHASASQGAAGSPPRPDVMPDEEENAPAEAAPTPQPDVDLYDPALAGKLAERSQQKLEHRDVLDAIELGEQAVLHDATNARAWVVLGAAYQQNGDMTNARRCYGRCVAGVQLPGDKSREDCAAMLQK